MLRSGGGISSGRQKPLRETPKTYRPGPVDHRWEMERRRVRRIAEADAHLAARTGTYEYRCQRYRAAADEQRRGAWPERMPGWDE